MIRGHTPPAARPGGPDGRVVAGGVALAVVVAVAFLPALGNAFVNWDDTRNFLGNTRYRGLGPAQLRWAFTTNLLGVYQPLAWVFFEAEYAVWGLNAWGYHLVSLVFHVGNSLALSALIVTLLDLRPREGGRPDRRAAHAGAFAASALFAVHPLRVEAVAWASCQPYLPCALFMLLTVLVYLRRVAAGGPGRVPWLVAAWLLFLASLLCKALAVTLPVVLAVLNVYPLRRLGPGGGGWFGPGARRVWAELSPFAALSLVFAVIAVGAREATGGLAPLGPDGLESRAAQASFGACFYLARTVVPEGLTVIYPLPSGLSLTRMPYLACALAVVAVTAASVGLRRRWPGFGAAWVCYLVILSPHLGLARVGDHLAADRYSYAASAVLAVLAAYGLTGALSAGPGRRLRVSAVAAAVAAALAASVALTWAQCRTWRDSEALWGHALSHGASGSERVHVNLGQSLEARGRFDDALASYARAERLNRRSVAAVNNQGAILARRGDFRGAMTFYARSLRIEPDNPVTHNHIGLARVNLGDDAGAAASFEEAVRLDPRFVDARVNLARVRARLGDFESAAAGYARALELEPDNARARRGLREVLPRARFGARDPRPG